MLLIDIPEKEYEDLKNNIHISVPNLIKYIENGTPIPNNATNGDVIKMMFPEINKYFSNVVDWQLWWNAQYQKEECYR